MTHPAARRYAAALTELAAAESALDKVVSDLRGLWAGLSECPELLAALNNPSFMREERKSVLLKAIDGQDVHPIARNFLCLLLDNNRMDAFHDILTATETLFDEQAGVVRAQVSSATPLDEATIESLREHLLKVTGKKSVILEPSVDPELIGGIVTRVGDLVFDGSLKTQLRLIRQKLLNQETAAEA